MGSQRYVLKASKTERQWRTMKNEKNEGSRAAISCYTRPAPPNFSSAPNRSCDCCWATSTLPYHATCITLCRDFSPYLFHVFCITHWKKRNQPTLMHRQSMSQKTQPTQAPPAAPGYAGHPALLGADASTTWTPPQRAWSSTQIRVFMWPILVS